MKEPSVFHYTLLVFVSLVFAVAGLYLLANFSRLLRNSIKNELLRKNVAAWLIILCISVGMTPLSGGFFYLLEYKVTRAEPIRGHALASVSLPPVSAPWLTGSLRMNGWL